MNVTTTSEGVKRTLKTVRHQSFLAPDRSGGKRPMSNYPPGIGPGTTGAPWNEPPEPECDCCGNHIDSPSDHEIGCELSECSRDDLYRRYEEDAKIEKAERRLEDRRVEEGRRRE